MRSRASFKSHALHPMLIPFPLAFLVGALLFDLAGLALGSPGLSATAGHLAIAGVAAALLAAVPGAIDLGKTVPPRSSARTRGLKHAAANLSATTLFAVAWLVRADGPEGPGLGAVGLEAAGALLLVMGSWMGGTLVARNQIGIDHRYAGAGKWKERSPASADGGTSGDGWRTVARADELERDQMMLLHLDGRRVVLARTEDGYAAFEDRCTHKGGSLADGALMCGTVQCPWHGSQFDVRTGACRAGPAEQGVGVFPVEVRDGKVRVRLGG